MRGLVIISHGKLCEGFLDAAKVIYGDITNVFTVSLKTETSPDVFYDKLKSKIDQLGETDEIIILADLTGGTPSNIASRLANERIHVISGMNFALLLELLVLKDSSSPIDYSGLAAQSKETIVYMNDFLKGREV